MGELATVEGSSIREKLDVQPPSVSEWVNMLIFGDTGVGKTHFLGTAADCPAFSPLLIIDCEGGLATIRHRTDIDVVVARTMKDLEKIHNELFLNNDNHYKCVGIDSVTEIQDLDMRTIMRETKMLARNPDNVDIDVPSPREWGKSRNHIRAIVRAFRDLQMHCIITALHTEVSEEGRPDRLQPDLPGKQRVEIPGFMDIVGYYYKEDGNLRKMQFTGTKRVPKAKTRYSELGDVIDNPTIPILWEKLNAIAQPD